jgi:ribosomal protein L37AE/L43A
MLKRRLTNLETTGGYIHDNLRTCVNEKLGHERGVYFCYKCKTKMTEKSIDVFQCPNCNVKYDTTKYQFKRPHKHLVQTVTAGNNDGYEIDDDIFYSDTNDE